MGGLPDYSLSALGRPCPGEAQTPNSAGRAHPARCTVLFLPAYLPDCQKQAVNWRAAAIGRGGAVAVAADVQPVGSTFGGCLQRAVALRQFVSKALVTETVAGPQ